MIKDNNTEVLYAVGTLVAPKYETYGQLEECFFPENLKETIKPWHNVKIPAGTIGIVVGGVSLGHTFFYTVLWGGTLSGKKLMISTNKVARLIINI